MEGVAFGLRDCFEVLTAMGVEITQVRASGGGARSALWRQIQADATGRSHFTLSVDEGPALGVALLAGVGTGGWGSVPEACAAALEIVDERKPCPEATSRYNSYYALYQKLYAQLTDCFDEVQALIE